MDINEIINENIIFPKGKKITSNYFTGTVWLEMLVANDGIYNCPIGNVTFEPGARNNWHQHPGGQLLLVTGGKGYYQEWGKPAQAIQAGDVVKIQPNIKHWHGASPHSWMSHIAISTNIQAGEAEWLEPVTEENYKQLE
jgi:quercetin dioxygenase-like cupin family protein